MFCKHKKAYMISTDITSLIYFFVEYTILNIIICGIANMKRCKDVQAKDVSLKF